ARQVVLHVGAAHLHAIDPGGVGIVDAADAERDARLRPGRRQFEAGAVPGHAVHAVPAGRLPHTGHGTVVPAAGVELARLPAGTVRRQGPARQVGAGLRQRLPVLDLKLARGLGQGIAVDALGVGIRPGLDAAAAPGAVDDADRHFLRVAQFAREEVRDRRERARRLGR